MLTGSSAARAGSSRSSHPGKHEHPRLLKRLDAIPAERVQGKRRHFLRRTAVTALAAYDFDAITRNDRHHDERGEWISPLPGCRGFCLRAAWPAKAAAWR
jgi:hypothetical protein